MSTVMYASPQISTPMQLVSPTILPENTEHSNIPEDIISSNNDTIVNSHSLMQIENIQSTLPIAPLPLTMTMVTKTPFMNSNSVNTPTPTQNCNIMSTETEKKGKHACAHCKKAHLACDFNRPCRRCINSGRNCVDADHKPRGRPRMREKDINSSSDNMPIRNNNYSNSSSSYSRQQRPSSGVSIASSSNESNRAISHINTPIAPPPSTFHGGMVGAFSTHMPFKRSTASLPYEQSEMDATSTITLMNIYLDSSLLIAKYPPLFASLFSFPVINTHICDLLVLPSEQLWLTSCVDSMNNNSNTRHYGRLHVQCHQALFLYDVSIRTVGMIEEYHGQAKENWYIVLSFGRGFEVLYDEE